MAISTRQFTDYLSHCEAVLTVLRIAGLPLLPPDELGTPGRIGVSILPALTALQITRGGRARFRRTLARGDYAADVRFSCDERGQAWLVLPLADVLPMLHFSKHPVGRAFAVWDSEVNAALLRHGWYDPATNHQVPAGAELDAIEIQTEVRDRSQAFWGRSWEDTWGRAYEHLEEPA